MDVLGHLLRLTPNFRGKWRLINYWSRNFRESDLRIACLPTGDRVQVDLALPFERMIWLQQEEWDDLLFLGAALQCNETFIDVGANIGTWTLVGANVVGKSGCVLAVEPNPYTARKLGDNVKLNCFQDIVTVVEAAASDVDGTCWLSCPQQHNLSSIVTPYAHDSVEVRTLRLEKVIADHCASRVIAGVKIDAEGHEAAVLQGCGGKLGAHKPWLIVEFNTTLLKSSRLGDWDVTQFLTSIGYKPFLFSSRSLTSVSLDWPLNGYRNILFLHKNGDQAVFQKLKVVDGTK